MLYFVLLALLLGASCDAVNNDYEYASGEPLEGTSLDSYRYYLQESSDGENSSYQEDDELQKREIPPTTAATPDDINPSKAIPTHRHTIPLANLIGQVEGTIFKSALSVVAIAKAQNSSESGKPSESAGNQLRSPASIDDLTSEQDAIFKYVTARSIPAKDNQPPHYIVDEIAISKANAGLGPLISSLDFHIEPTVSSPVGTPKHGIPSSDLTIGQATGSDLDVTVFVTPTHTPQVSPTILSVDDKTTENIVKIAPKSVSSSSTVAPTSTSTSTTSAPSTTTKTPIEKLKEAEDNLKEKVAEIEAEPVILSARV